MQRWPFFLAVALIALTPDAYGARARWTVMIFMNGDNNLESDAVLDFNEIAEVGGTADVNVVVQFDRYVPENALTEPDWSDAYRFVVGKDTKAIPVNAVQSLGEVNMVAGAVLADFVIWAREHYKADRYALILWGHGNGYRRIGPETSQEPCDEEDAPPAGARLSKPITLPMGTLAPPVRGTSSDWTTRGEDMLYTSELTAALQLALGKGNQLDLIGFDTCLMGMTEVAYAMRDVAKVMISSEDLEPGEGWDYTRWLAPLIANPSAYDARSLARLIVRSYKDSMREGSFEDRTLAAIDLTQTGDLVDLLSTLSGALIRDLGRQKRAVDEARRSCLYYAPKSCERGTADCVFHVDLRKFTEGLAQSRFASAAVRRYARSVSDCIDAMVIDKYRGPLRVDHGSHGLAIYFPATRDEYACDPLAPGAYYRSNREFPVTFVADRKVLWVDFLQAYLDVRDGAACGE